MNLTALAFCLSCTGFAIWSLVRAGRAMQTAIATDSPDVRAAADADAGGWFPAGLAALFGALVAAYLVGAA